ncbi:MAG: serine hydrolase [Acidobacteria bacterium]|nr:serine hydrolase [Acidobacteriota bacterium]
MTRRLLALLLLSLPAAGQRLDADKLAAIERLIEAKRLEGGAPGLSAAIAIDGRVLWEKGFGLADVEHGVPARPDTRYRTASIAKPMTAVALMRQVELGRMDLDVRIQRYVPSFPEKRWPITVRQILGHLSGIRHYQGEEFRSTAHYEHVADGLTVFQDDPLLFQPGEKYSYSTYGFNLLGAAVEGASGEEFVTTLTKTVLEPAAMWSTRTDAVEDIIPHRARGYRMDAAGKLRNCDLADTSVKIPGGGLVSTAGDLTRFAMALQEGRLLEPETVEEMFTPQRTLDGKVSRAGLSWMIAEKDGMKRVFHSGGQQGATTRLILLPERGVALAAMANLEGYSGLPELCEGVLEILLAP